MRRKKTQRGSNVVVRERRWLLVVVWTRDGRKHSLQCGEFKTREKARAARANRIGSWLLPIQRAYRVVSAEVVIRYSLG